MRKITKKCLPVIDGVFSVPEIGFAFIAKEGKSEYHVYDIRNIRPVKRQLARLTGDEDSIKLQIEILECYASSYKQVSDNAIEVWDGNVEEYEDVELPLYRKNKDRTFTYLNTTFYLKNVPTLKMVTASKEALANIKKRVSIDAIIAEVECNMNVSFDGVSTVIKSRISVEDILDKEKYYTFLIKEPYKGRGQFETLVIEKSNVGVYAEDGVLQIGVPMEVAGIVIGKEGRCSKKIAADLGLRYLDVKAIG